MPPDVLPTVTGDAGPTEAKPVILVDEFGVTYNAADASQLPVKGNHVIIDVILSMDTAQYQANDVMADTQVIADVFSAIDGGGVLESVTVLDRDHQSAANNAVDIYFLDNAQSIGEENAVPSSGWAGVVCKVSLVAADFSDFTFAMVGSVGGLHRVVRAVGGTKSLALAVVTQGAPTHAADGVHLRLGLTLD